MVSSTLQVPPSFISNVFQTVGTTLNNFKGVIVLMIGILIFFWLAEELIGWIADRREASEDLETKISKLERSYKISAGTARAERFEMIAKTKEGRRAMELRQQFKGVMAGEGVDIET
jgi:hypothetical protein